ncbi:MAG: putative selenate reductase subunit YgfK [Eubacteriales bacterium]|nr:putative selenate reductase subunit YgfK [Eubacteriales bacterium]
MGEKMTPIPFHELMEWILTEKKNSGTVFGIRKPYVAKKGKFLDLFGEKLETIFGPAAGPHTQLSQNIIASYYAGSRFFELKTCQIMDGDELSACVNRPCILANDECYNCEWSTELYVWQAETEYIRAWYALKLLSKEWGLGDPDGFIFNISVGYDLAGVQSEKIDTYLNHMMDARGTDVWKECEEWAYANLHRFENITKEYLDQISPRVSHSVTVSTLHGCPPNEIEAIASHLIKNKHMHTFIKCNPTLLGFEEARQIMDDMGYDYVAFGDFHFLDDLQFEDAVPMLERLQVACDERDLQFGVKITNTFPVDVTRNELPSEEMYMAGRSLYALSTKVALNLSRAFKGKLRISYSGGADVFSMVKLYEAGIWPVTMATTMLKPGGYGRLVQIGKEFDDIEYKPFEGISIAAVDQIHYGAHTDPHYVKQIKPLPTRKVLGEKVPLFDCFFAPCTQGCPINQDVPTYIHLEGIGQNKEALRVILDKNPLPFMTGTICNHRCQERCTRNFYEETVRIRRSKLRAAKSAYDEVFEELHVTGNRKDLKVAIIGGGPAGVAAAHFLAREGAQVTVFEKRDALGGVVRHMIPDFRIPNTDIEKDCNMIRKLGVEVKLNTEVTDLEELRKQGYNKIILAIGAHNHGAPGIKEGETDNSLEFLEAAKKDLRALRRGKAVAVIGAGNTAMDVARVAKRIPGVEDVYLIYRRTARYMPADEEELELALADGVIFKELMSPVSFKDGKLLCKEMKLGEPDESGRRKPVETGKEEIFEVDRVITAIGEQVDPTIFKKNGIETDERGRAVINTLTYETKVPGVYAIGDGALGAATIVQGIADAQKAVNSILHVAPRPAINLDRSRGDVIPKRAILHHSCDTCEEQRCIECHVVCESCVDVCPNRANLTLKVNGMKKNQIVHVDYMCNECGNCMTFCPWDSAPYKEKFTLFHNEEDFKDSTNEGFYMTDRDEQKFVLRLNGEEKEYSLKNPGDLDPQVVALVEAINNEYKYLLIK